jgi:transcriptional regulator with XRE-family HTH domain
MPSPRQIRAARALLGWESGDLAKHTGLSRVTISNIETARTQPHEESISSIARALDAAGVEFLDHDGVRIKPHGVDVLTGQEGLHEFFEAVYAHTRDHGGAIVQFGVDEQKFRHHLGAEFSNSYMQRMAEVARSRKDVKVRAIICDGDTNFLASSYNEYKWIARDLFQAVPFYIYGNTLAVMDFQTVPSPTIVLLNFPAITSAYRTQFEAFWRLARTPPSKSKRT